MQCRRFKNLIIIMYDILPYMILQHISVILMCDHNISLIPELNVNTHTHRVRNYLLIYEHL